MKIKSRLHIFQPANIYNFITLSTILSIFKPQFFSINNCFIFHSKNWSYRKFLFLSCLIHWIFMRYSIDLSKDSKKKFLQTMFEKLSLHLLQHNSFNHVFKSSEERKQLYDTGVKLEIQFEFCLNSIQSSKFNFLLTFKSL